MFSIAKNWVPFVGVSVVAMLASVIGLFVFGLRLGIDFTGGVLWQQVQSPAIESREQLRDAIVAQGAQWESAVVQQSNDAYSIKLPYADDAQLTALQDALTSNYEGLTIGQKLSVGPTIGDSLRQKALIAVILSLAFVMLVLSISFRSVGQLVPAWLFGALAIVSLLHDVLILLGVFVLLGAVYAVEVDQLFVIALLTLLGYSVNDTIVIFDRIRANLQRARAEDTMQDIVDSALWQTMPRSLNTTGTVLIVLLALLVFGPASTYWFVLALFVGTLVGAYSSIFFAAPLLGLIVGGRRSRK